MTNHEVGRPVSCRAFPDEGFKAEPVLSKPKLASVQGQRHKSSPDRPLLFVNGGYLAHDADRVHPWG